MLEMVVCLICAVIYGLFCWNSTFKSDAEPAGADYLFLIVYQCLSLLSYLGILWLFARRSTFRGLEPFVVLSIVSVVGTVVPYVASSIQIWLKYRLELGWFLRQSAIAGLLHLGGMWLVTMFIYTTFFLLTWPLRRVTRNLDGI